MGAESIVTTVVTDNGALLTGNSSFEAVKNIVVKLDRSATDENIVQMKLSRISGSVEVLSPKNAATHVQIQGLEPVDNLPQIGKSILLKGGAGEESLVLSTLDVGKGLVFPAGKGIASAFTFGDVSFGSNVSLLGTNTVNLGGETRIDGNLLITQKTTSTESFILSAGSEITGNVVIFAGPGSTSINAYSDVGGHVSVYAGQGANAFNVSLTAKSLQYVGGSSLDIVALLRGDITGSALFILAGGNNQLMFDRGVFDLSGDFTVGKNFSVGGGKDSDLIRLDHSNSPDHSLIVGKKTVFSLGSGDNIMVWDGASTGTSINYSGGNGVDIVNVFGVDAPDTALNVDLGGGNDRLLLSNTFAKASLNGSSGNDEIVNGSVLPAKTKLKKFEIGV
ncbi:MAG: hypothetical protein EOP84_27055 [Verrucomicrobiaceae bacterium]|nr:MAG: hypothetical protein EOP84_27055 [Verrucomicrobiaceae bacterium]